MRLPIPVARWSIALILAFAAVASLPPHSMLRAETPASVDAAYKNESPKAAASPNADESGLEPKVPPPVKEEHKKQLVTVGMLLLVGVSLIGLILIGMTIAWGGRLRRIVRKPLPQQSPVDELWYLKSKKNAAGASKPNESSPDSGSEPPADRSGSP